VAAEVALDLKGECVADDTEGMKLALALAAEAANAGEVPVGAVIVLDGKVVGCGSNAPITSLDPTAHAEINAIRDAATSIGNYRLSGATLYVTVEPCSMCAGAIVHSRVARVVFGTTEPKAGVAESAEQFFSKPFLNHRVDIAGGVEADACSSIMTAFFAARRAGKRRLKKASAADGSASE